MCAALTMPDVSLDKSSTALFCKAVAACQCSSVSRNASYKLQPCVIHWPGCDNARTQLTRCFVHTGHVQREPRSPSLPPRPAQTAAPVNLPESPGLKVPAALFVAQSPSEDRNKAKEVWVAHHVRNCGKTIEQAEAGESLD